MCMVRIITITRIGKLQERYVIVFSNNERTNISVQTKNEFFLFKNKVLDNSKIDEMRIYEQEIQIIDDLISIYKIKYLNEKQLTLYITKKYNISVMSIQKIIKNLSIKGLLNDKLYIENIFEKQLFKKSKNAITKKLIEKGFCRKLIQEISIKLDEDNFIVKKIAILLQEYPNHDEHYTRELIIKKLISQLYEENLVIELCNIHILSDTIIINHKKLDKLVGKLYNKHFRGHDLITQVFFEEKVMKIMEKAHFNQQLGPIILEKILNIKKGTTFL